MKNNSKFIKLIEIIREINQYNKNLILSRLKYQTALLFQYCYLIYLKDSKKFNLLFFDT